MTNAHRWLGTVLLLALLFYSKEMDVLPLPPGPGPNPTADKLWIVALDDLSLIHI